MTASEVFDDTFEREVLQSTEPVLVDFFTTWCGPCKVMAPLLDEAAREFEGKVKIVKIDVGHARIAREKYSVRAVPTLMLFKNGKAAARHRGALVQKRMLDAWLTRALELPDTSAHEVTRWTLPNGMDVIVIPDHRAPVVMHTLWYKFGAADAPYGASGIARLVERLSSKVVEKFAPIQTPKAGLSREGERRAFTEQDCTRFIQHISKDQLQAVMEMEAHRMTSASISDEDIEIGRHGMADQRRSRVEDNPIALLGEQMNAALYVSHPYGNPIVGWPHHVANLSRVEAERFYRRHYVPNNAILVVSGAVAVDEVKHLVKATYAKLPSNPDGGMRSSFQEAPHIAERRLTLRHPRTRKPYLQRCYAVPGYLSAEQSDVAAIEVLARILGSGATGRLHSKLVEQTQVAVATGARYTGASRDSGVILLFATVGGGEIKVLDAEFDGVIQEIREHGVTAAELEAAKTALTSHFSPANDSAAELATRYGEGMALGRTIEQIDGWPEAISKVTLDEVRNAAVTYLDGRRSVTGWLLPAGERADVLQGPKLAEAV